MSSVQEPHLHLEIGHILFLDLVGYSKLLVDEQKAWLDELNRVVRSTEQFRAAEAEGKLIKLPTGDGMVLVFTNNPEAPIECALEISRALQGHPKLKLRMGIHSGPVNPVADVNDRSNLAGAGINIAQRVMDCGDAGHILLSKHFAEDLEHYAHWRSNLHNVGEIEVKHGVRIPLVNFYTDQFGNPKLPEKLKRARTVFRFKTAAVATLLLIAALGVGLWIFRHRTSPQLASGRDLVPYKSIAVLPFENLSADPENAFFTDGVQDEILNDLAKIADLKVISRTSVMQYKTGAKRNVREIANELGVAHLVEGSVQRAANRVRVSAQLIDARTDRHVWVERYDRPLDDVFAIQTDIAKAIAGQLQAKLSPAEKSAIEQPPTTNLVAYNRYVRAEKLLRQEGDLREITRLLDQAVAYDPTFLLAYCLLAQTHVRLYFIGVDHTSSRLALAKAARDTALRLGPDSGEAHLAAAWVAYHGYRDYETALTEVGIARSRLPNDASVFEIAAFIARRQGHWKQSTSNFERAVELDPRSPRSVWLLSRAAVNYAQHRRFSEAVAALDRALAIEPGNPAMRFVRAFVDMESRADTQPANEAVQSIVNEDPSGMNAVADMWFDLALRRRDGIEMSRAIASLPAEQRSFCEGLAARTRNDGSGVEMAFTAARVEFERKVREQPDDAEALSNLGITDAALGRKEDALREGRRAVELLPVTKDAATGPELLKGLAVIYAWVGEKDLAIKQLEEILWIPGNISYGQLRLHPYWDPLRADPRFGKLLEESKKPVAVEP
jgi:TolB-like protein/Flp pilus assembly protein TadD